MQKRKQYCRRSFQWGGGGDLMCVPQTEGAKNRNGREKKNRAGRKKILIGQEKRHNLFRGGYITKFSCRAPPEGRTAGGGAGSEGGGNWLGVVLRGKI